MITIERVGECARCGGDHENVLAKPFAIPPPGWSHFGVCPTNGEPILVRVEALASDAAQAVPSPSVGCTHPNDQRVDTSRMGHLGSYICRACGAEVE